jgi:tRNA(Ile)-lysidine synthase
MMNPGNDSSNDFLESVTLGLPRSWDWRQPVLVGVSGGADSMALLHGLVAVGKRQGANVAELLRVAHVEYDLRANASGDRKFVQEQAAAFGLTCHWRRLPVAKTETRLPGEGLEAAARRVRYHFFTEIAGEFGARHVAVGHTRDDQAETILHRILRGTGLNGLAGMPRARQLAEGVSLVRPLLGIRRQQVLDYLEACEFTWREDESNKDTAFSRNFLRHCLLTQAEQGPYPAATEALARLGEQATEYAAQRQKSITQALAVGVTRGPDGAVLVTRQLAADTGGDAHLLADVLLGLWRQQGWPRQALSHQHLRTLAAMCMRTAGVAQGDAEPAAVDLPGGIRATAPPAGIWLSRKLA